MAADRYSFASRLLHRIALSSNTIAGTAFDVEKALYGGCEDEGQHVFIAGLARAGTTLLMRLLYDTGEFCSLTYRDMPFVMAPNLWAGVSRHSQKMSEATERAHGDGLLVDFDSPEALEEIFWRVHCGDDYISPDYLRKMTADSDVLVQFRQYVQLVLLRYDTRRYLSKNNNNILRLRSIAAAYPHSLLLVPFRHPLTQTRSLLNQHQHFSFEQKKVHFVRQYMDWLVHCEFGNGHKPFFRKASENFSTTQQEYWLELWITTYRYLLKQASDGIINLKLVSYEALCSDPYHIWSALADSANISTSLPTRISVSRPPPQPTQEGVDAKLLEQAEMLYQQLRRLSEQQLKLYPH